MAVLKSDRQKHKENCNNPENINKNICILAIANNFGVSNNTHYLHTTSDLIRSLRKAYTVRSCKSKLKKDPTVGGSRAKFVEIAQVDKKIVGFFLTLHGEKSYHGILLHPDGSTIIDTDPRKNDRRKIVYCHYIKIDDLKKYLENTDENRKIKVTLNERT